ncbi:MAG: hypothetical protein QM722_15060 [Piscinibacter sp.]
MPALAESPTKPAGHAVLTVAQRTSLGIELERTGRAQLAPGVAVVRPLRDIEPESEHPTGYATRAELAAVRAAFAPLADNERQQHELDELARDARCGVDTTKRATLPALAERADQLKAEHEKLHGSARLAVLAAIDAAATRAGARYRAACDMLADAAADVEGLARLRDNLLNVATFDPLGVWERGSALLAPPLAYRPRGWSVSLDAWGRECYWTPSSAGHADAVRRTQQAFRAELDPTLAGARWPF